MKIGVIVGLILGSAFVFGGIRSFQNRDWKRKQIKEWLHYPKTTAKITGTISMGTMSQSEGYCYEADLIVDGMLYRGKSYDRFHEKRTCEIGEVVEVAYKPIENNQVLDSVMGAMTSTLLNENWEESKPRYYFKFLDETKYLNEENGGSVFSTCFFVGFGLLVILISVLSQLGVIA